MPPTLLVGDRGKFCAPGAVARGSWPAGDGDDAVAPPSESCSDWAVREVSTSPCFSWLVGSDAGNSSDLRNAVSCLRARVSGLVMARVDFVGVVEEGICGDLEGEEGCGSDGCACSACCCCGGGGGPGEVVDSTGTDSVGEVLRRLGAEGSII